ATALRRTRLRISAALVLWDAGLSIPCTGGGLWRVRTGLCRTRARVLRSGSLLRRTRLCGGICAEAASAPALPCAGAMRRGLWKVGLLRLDRGLARVCANQGAAAGRISQRVRAKRGPMTGFA